MIQELPFLTKNVLGMQTEIDLDNNLTLAGHGFGATSVIYYASKDPRVKKIISYDPWLLPI